MLDKKSVDKQQNGEENTATKKWTREKILNIVGIVLCVLLIPILIINCILIVQGLVNEDKVPSLGGNTPLIVLTESMEPYINGGDLIIVKDADPKDIKVGDVISFFDPASNGSAVVTHRVIEVIEKDGQIYWNTQGDNNISADKVSVPAENLVGLYHEGDRVAGLGSVAMFMQSTWGLILCIGVPLAALVTYELLRYKKANKSKQKDVDALMAELEALKAAQNSESPAAPEAENNTENEPKE